MRSLLETDERVGAFEALVDQWLAEPVPSRDAVERLRQAFYREGVVDRRRAAHLFHANRALAAHDDDWTEFFLEAVSDFFLERNARGTSLSAEAEATLLAWLGEDSSTFNVGERRLLVRLFLRAGETSERFERRVFEALQDNFLCRSERWLDGCDRSAGMIDAHDLCLIQRLLYRSEEQAGAHPSRASLDFLLDLDQQAQGFADPDIWRRLLVEITTRYLTPEPLAATGTSPRLRLELPAWLLTALKRAEIPTEAVLGRDSPSHVASSFVQTPET